MLGTLRLLKSDNGPTKLGLSSASPADEKNTEVQRTKRLIQSCRVLSVGASTGALQSSLSPRFYSLLSCLIMGFLREEQKARSVLAQD